MDSTPPTQANGQTRPEKRPLSLTALRRRLDVLQWLLPGALLLLVVLYELGPARWIHDRLGDTTHFVAEILVYGSVGPLLAFWLLRLLGRWLEERETSELQAQVLAEAREHARVTHDLTDNVLQSLFGLSVLLTSLKESLPGLTPDAQAQLEEAEQAINRTFQQLYANTSHLRRG